MLTFVKGRPLVSTGTVEVGLDWNGGDLSFVSHAHSDHAAFVRKATRLMASEETISITEALGKSPSAPEKVEGIRLAEAGHILGSRQLVADCDGGRAVYTGDFNPEPSLTCGAAEPVECDELLTECTYGAPEWVFPRKEDVYSDMGRWAGKVVESGEIAVLGGYSVGKAQELVAVLNKYAGLVPLVPHNIARINKAYGRHGVGLDFIDSSSEEAARYLKGAFAAVIPFNQVSLELAASLGAHYGRRVRTAVATGWALNMRQAGVDAAFPLSDHADFPKLMDFIQATGAGKVYCAHGFAGQCATSLRERGINAVAVDSIKGQTRLVA